MRIFVAGHGGLVGSALVRNIERSGAHEWIGATRSELNLTDFAKTVKFMEMHKPDAVIIAAAKVGGIIANRDFPIEFLLENLKIQNSLIEACDLANIERVVFLGSSCIYPKHARQPIKEEYLLTGPLESTNEPYAIAKIAGVKLIDAYRAEKGRDWVSVMPTNLYGPEDNFDLKSSHVIPALIRKIHDAKLTNAPTLTLYGDGTPLREFLFVDDLASAVMKILANSSEESLINVGSGEEVSIRELALRIADIANYRGQILWDSTMPNGTPRKLLDSHKINKLGWGVETPLTKGIRVTYEWFLHNHLSKA